MKKALLNELVLGTPEMALNQAAKCPNEFSCISSERCGDAYMCKVEAAHSENILFIECKQHHVCPYRLSVGEDQICRCPVRFAIYKRDGH
jgi:hypothetical protein